MLMITSAPRKYLTTRLTEGSPAERNPFIVVHSKFLHFIKHLNMAYEASITLTGSTVH
jgi:hypothetical protein